MASHGIFVLLICASYILVDSLRERKGPTWPDSYYLQAEKIDVDVTGNILQTSVLQFYGPGKVAVVTYYDDTVQTWYQWRNSNRGAKVTIQKYVRLNTEKYTGDVCLEKVTNESVSLLPQLEGYTYQGQTTLEGKVVDAWRCKAKGWDKRTIYEFTLYTYQSEEDDNVDVPVRYVEKTFTNAWTKLVITNYYGYNSNHHIGYTQHEITKYNGTGSRCIYIGQETGDTVDEQLRPNRPNKDHIFQGYKRGYAKNYDSESEHAKRRMIFQENLRMVEDHNSQNLSYKMELNQFADRTPEEMGLTRIPGLDIVGSVGTHAFPHSDEEISILADQLPETYDMRMEGYISPVKHQGSCGACWAFAATAAVEGALARSYGGRIVDLSEQTLIDCAWDLEGELYYTLGCDGGYATKAFHYIMEHGLPMDYEYGPFLEQDGYCHAKNMTKTFTINGYARATPFSPQALKVALYNYGPVVVSINFTKRMALYSSGIFYDPDCNAADATTNHAVLVVGYGLRDGVDYWLIKNSYGTNWGEAGYILISAKNNHCFVLSYPYYPIV